MASPPFSSSALSPAPYSNGGAAFFSLPETLRRLHGVRGTARYAGIASIERGRGLLARLCARIAGLPKAMRDAPDRPGCALRRLAGAGLIGGIQAAPQPVQLARLRLPLQRMFGARGAGPIRIGAAGQHALGRMRAGVLGALARGVLAEPAFDVGGDAGVQAAVATAQQVQVPA